jgi:hypothetical protein
VYTVAPSRFSAGTAYVTVDLHQENDRNPYVYRTSDFGLTWKSLSATLPKGPLSYAHAIAEDTVRQGLLFLGTENSLYVSFDDGEKWQPLQNNLPHVPVYGITVQEHFGDLVLATYGRGFWILDDIAPLRALTPGVLDADAHLFAPRPAYRFRGITPPAAPAFDLVDGENPPYGAAITYYLKASPSGDARIDILDGVGNKVRTLPVAPRPGMNRVWWDLRYAPEGDVRLRTSPMFASWMKVGAEGRPAGGRLTLLASPGSYTVKLTVGGHEFTQPLKVIKDPHSAGTEADIRAQFTLLQSIRDDMLAAGEMVNKVELLRKQVEDLESKPSAAQVKPAAETFDAKLIDFEQHLYQLKLTGGQDGMRWPGQLLQKLSHLVGGLQDSDFPPTTQEIAVNQQFTEEIGRLRRAFAELTTRDVPAFNAVLAAQNLPAISVTP